MNKYELQKRLGEIKNLCNVIEVSTQDLWRKCSNLDDDLIDSNLTDVEIKEAIANIKN